MEILPYNLPEGWVWLKLKELNRRSKSSNIKPFNFKDEIFESYSVPIFPTGEPEEVEGGTIKSSKQILNEGDILICKINPRINRVWVVKKKTKYRQIGSSEWIVITPFSVVIPKYLVGICQSSYFRHLLTSNGSDVGGSLTRARPKEVIHYPIPLPPLQEQHRIVAKLDRLLGKVQTAQALSLIHI